MENASIPYHSSAQLASFPRIPDTLSIDTHPYPLFSFEEKIWELCIITTAWNKKFLYVGIIQIRSKGPKALPSYQLVDKMQAPHGYLIMENTF